jgi:hypothetical protein
MKTGKHVTIILAALILFGALTPTAHAKHAPRQHYKIKKNFTPYGGNYLASKKQPRPTGRYRSPITGNTLFGKPVKQK